MVQNVLTLRSLKQWIWMFLKRHKRINPIDSGSQVMNTNAVEPQPTKSNACLSQSCSLQFFTERKNYHRGKTASITSTVYKNEVEDLLLSKDNTAKKNKL